MATAKLFAGATIGLSVKITTKLVVTLLSLLNPFNYLFNSTIIDEERNDQKKVSPATTLYQRISTMSHFQMDHT